MEIIILCLGVGYVVTVDAIFKYKLRCTNSYNEGYHQGYKDRLKATMVMATEANEDLCKKFSAQFKAKMNEMPPAERIDRHTGTHPLNFKTYRFKASTYSISFYIEPNSEGYVSI